MAKHVANWPKMTLQLLRLYECHFCSIITFYCLKKKAYTTSYLFKCWQRPLKLLSPSTKGQLIQFSRNDTFSQTFLWLLINSQTFPGLTSDSHTFPSFPDSLPCWKLDALPGPAIIHCFNFFIHWFRRKEKLIPLWHLIHASMPSPMTEMTNISKSMYTHYK